MTSKRCGGKPREPGFDPRDPSEYAQEYLLRCLGCPDCEREKCGACGGSHRVLHPDQYAEYLTQPEKNRWVPCPDCATCPKCGGTKGERDAVPVMDVEKLCDNDTFHGEREDAAREHARELIVESREVATAAFARDAAAQPDTLTCGGKPGMPGWVSARTQFSGETAHHNCRGCEDCELLSMTDEESKRLLSIVLHVIGSSDEYVFVEDVVRDLKDNLPEGSLP